MNFFASVFADDPDPSSPKSESESDSESVKAMHAPQHEQNLDSTSSSSSNPNPSPGVAGVGAWSFGGLIKTLTTKSESVLETYRRDLEEFKTGLKKELEVAHGSLGTVSTVLDEFGNTVLKSTAQIKEAILAADHESDSSESNSLNNQNNSSEQRWNNRLNSQLRAILRNVSTYCEEVDDLDDYNKWKSGFILDDVNEEIEILLAENGAMESIYRTVVPNNVDHETFWSRYFYRVFKIKQAEDMRASIVKRVISREEEDLSWDIEDDDDDEVEENEDQNVIPSNVAEKVNSKEDICSKPETVSGEENVAEKSDSSENKVLGDKESAENVKGEKLWGDDVGKKTVETNVDADGKESVGYVENENMGTKMSDGGRNKENSGVKSEEKMSLMGKVESGDSSKASDSSVVSSNPPPTPEEEDLGWDEIEDLSSIEEKKETQGGSSNRTELRKRLSVAEEEEDLSWDIEDDDDEPVKA